MSGPRYREGQQIELAALAAQCRRLRMWIVMLAVVMAFTAFAAAVANVKACESRHTIVAAGERIIPSEARLRAMLEAGRITREEYERGLASLAAWRNADCHWKHWITP